MEVDGIFISNDLFNTMIQDVVTAGQSMWEVIQQRLVTVIQRPYQMFNIRENTEEDENLSLQIEQLKQHMDKLQLQVQLEMKEKELFKEIFTQMEKQKVVHSVGTQTEEVSDKEKDIDKLVTILQKIIDKGDSTNKPELQAELDMYWEDICSMLDHYRELKIADNQKVETESQSVKEQKEAISDDGKDHTDDQSENVQDGEQITVSNERLEQMAQGTDEIIRQIGAAYKDTSTEEDK